MKEIKVIQGGRGYFRGGVFDKDVCPTIDCHITCWHVLIMEIENELGNDSELEKQTKPVRESLRKE